jgi:hypothetical protein
MVNIAHQAEVRRSSKKVISGIGPYVHVSMLRMRAFPAWPGDSARIDAGMVVQGEWSDYEPLLVCIVNSECVALTLIFRRMDGWAGEWGRCGFFDGVC